MCGVMLSVVKWTRSSKFKSWTRLIAYNVAPKTFGKRMNLTIPLPTRQFSLTLAWQLISEMENSKSKLAELP